MKSRVALVLVLVGIMFGAMEGYADGFRKYPYLVYPGCNTEMVILWQLDDSEEAVVSWGETPRLELGSTVSAEYGDDHQHSVRLSELKPDTVYHYRVAVGGDAKEGVFQTAPNESATTLKFFGIADTQFIDESFRITCYEMLAGLRSSAEWQTLVIHCGDWIDNGSAMRHSEALQEGDWTRFFSTSEKATATQDLLSRIPLQGAAGNHDLAREGRSDFDGYAKYWPYPYAAEQGHYWSFDYGPVAFVVLEVIDMFGSSAVSYEPGSAQYAWLQATLRECQARPWTIVFFHDPVQIPGKFTNPDIDGGTAVESIWPLFVEHGVDLVLAGHYHWECFIEHQGVPQYVMPASSSNWLIDVEVGYSTFEIEGEELTITSWAHDGEERSRYSVLSREGGE